MRAHGTLTKWNDDRGFGFITLPQSRAEVFVHISEFPRDGVRPRVGELIAFEIENGRDGRPRAVRISRPGANARRTPTAPRPTREHRASPVRAMVLGAAAVAGIAGFAYSELAPRLGSETSAGEPALVDATRDPGGNFSCDGRTHCSQMSSCEEARFFLRNCPNTEMDGNLDGEPCEQQWCN